MATWSTTFYYEQELRSAYMNNLIKGVITPGIYNMDAAIYTKDNTNVGQQGVWLHIRAGAQLIFSNGYAVTNNVLQRDLRRLGDYVVKCVAEEDVDIQLAALGGTNSAIFEATNAEDHITKAPVLFVYAMLKYDADASAIAEPTFMLAAPSSNEILGVDPSFQLPNEGLNPSDASADTRISYLMVGILVDNGKYAAPYGVNDWDRNGRNADVDWVRGHVFTAQGVQDYGSQLEKSFSREPVSFIFAEQYNRIYLTTGQFYFNSIFYNIDGTDCRAVHGQNTSPLITAPTPVSGMLTDHGFATAGASEYTKLPLTLTSLANKIIIEVLFMAINSEYSRSSLSNLDTLLTGGYNVSKRLLPYRVVCAAPTGFNLDTSSLWEDYGFASSTLIVPLDVSLVNIERLKNILANKNVILPIVDTIRQNGLASSPFLDPTVGESLIPLLISFRQVNATGDGFTDYQTLNSVAKFKDASGTVGASACNPANILSFFDLQSSSFEVTNVGLSAQEVFPTLPFVD